MPLAIVEIGAPVGNVGAGLTGNLPEDVRRVQYLFNKTSTQDGGTLDTFDTTSGVSDQALTEAIERFQTFHFRSANGLIEPGSDTLAKLNEVADLAAFNAAREPDEFKSWLHRPPKFNFTLEDRLRLDVRQPTFAPSASLWLPEVYQKNLFRTFDAMLNQNDDAPGTWGIGVWDLFHAHPVVFKDANGDPRDRAVMPILETIKRIDGKITNLRDRRNPRALATPVEILSYSAELFLILPEFIEPLSNLAKSGSAGLLYHSFESSDRFGGSSRYAGFQPADPRRRWLTALPDGIPTRFASADNPDFPDKDFFIPMEINFVIEKLGFIHAVGGQKDELIAVTLEPFSTIA